MARSVNVSWLGSSSSVDVTTEWRRYDIVRTAAATGTQPGAYISLYDAETLHAWGWNVFSGSSGGTVIAEGAPVATPTDTISLGSFAMPPAPLDVVWSGQMRPSVTGHMLRLNQPGASLLLWADRDLARLRIEWRGLRN